MAVPESPATGPKPFVFVLMPFGKKFADTYKFGIKGAADEVGAYAERVDEQMFEEGILDRIFNQINKADVVVADMTGKNPNVFYEVGYAHALNKIVLLLTQSADDIPFDLKHRQHIVYGGEISTLRTKLAERLSWAIEESRRREQGVGSYQLAVSCSGIDLPERSLGDIPLVTIEVAGLDDVIKLRVELRNDGTKISDAISHVYLFAEKGRPTLIPGKMVVVTEKTAIFGRQKEVTEQSEKFRYLDPLRASEVDKRKLGLPFQYRIPMVLPPIPPGGVEVLPLVFRTTAKGPTTDRFSLRLHTATNYLDFTFQLNIQPAKSLAPSSP